jgi:hypothetical protein
MRTAVDDAQAGSRFEAGTGSEWERSQSGPDQRAAGVLPMQDTAPDILGRFREPEQLAIFCIDDTSSTRKSTSKAWRQ